MLTQMRSELGRSIYETEKVKIYLSKDEKCVYKVTTSDVSKEYEIMNLIRSSYTVSAIDCIEESGCNCLVLPAYTEGDAFSLIEKNETSEKVAKQIIYEIIRGLICLESVNVIHHDIKPENVFLYKKGKTIHAVIGDFGYSEIFGNDDNPELGGTLPYIAPEILGGRSYDFKSDMWSVGVFMTYFLTHNLPFSGSYSQIVRQIFSKKVILPLQFSEDAQDLLEKLLCINPDERITAAEAIQHPWFDDVEQLNDDFENIDIDDQ